MVRRAELDAQIDDVRSESAKYERHVDSFDIAAQVMEWMIATKPEATQLFLAEEERGREEQLAAQRAKAVIAAACAELDKRYGGTHAIGSAGDEYKDFRLLGAVDIDRNRFARLQGHLKRVMCVPWIDGFAALIVQKLSVRWSEATTSAQVLRVSNDDGILDDGQDDALGGVCSHL